MIGPGEEINYAMLSMCENSSALEVPPPRDTLWDPGDGCVHVSVYMSAFVRMLDFLSLWALVLSDLRLMSAPQPLISHLFSHSPFWRQNQYLKEGTLCFFT